MKDTLDGQSEEIMFPGAHSDVGGGYAPKEQGRGVKVRGADMLSRIPLGVMYRKARLAGVPLKPEKMDPTIQYRMEVDPEVITRFNAYLDTLRQQGRSADTLAAYRRSIYGLYRSLPPDKRVGRGTLDRWRETLGPILPRGLFLDDQAAAALRVEHQFRARHRGAAGVVRAGLGVDIIVSEQLLERQLPVLQTKQLFQAQVDPRIG